MSLLSVHRKAIWFCTVCLVCSLTLFPLVSFPFQLRLDRLVVFEISHFMWVYSRVVVWSSNSLFAWRLLLTFKELFLVFFSAFSQKQLGLKLLTYPPITWFSDSLIFFRDLVELCWMQKIEIFSGTVSIDMRLVNKITIVLVFYADFALFVFIKGADIDHLLLFQRLN